MFRINLYEIRMNQNENKILNINTHLSRINIFGNDSIVATGMGSTIGNP